MNVGRTAPGIVFERLILGLSSIHKTDVLTADYDPSVNSGQVYNILKSGKLVVNLRIHCLFMALFGVDPFDRYWVWKSIRLLKKNNLNHYDIIISFLSNHNYASIIAGEEFSRKIRSGFVIHSVDAIPAPEGWKEPLGYYRGSKRFMTRHIGKADAFFTSNQQMLDYYFSIYPVLKSKITDVLYSPSLEKFRELPSPPGGPNNFVYTGGLYGARNIKYLIEGFEKLIKEYPDSLLIFVGSYLNPDNLKMFNAGTLNKIKTYPFTKDLDKYYSCATALIDIDADFDNDIFLSSKVVNYLMINRIIISETGINSPSSYLFKDMESVIQCRHDADQLYNAMKKAIILKDQITFEDRISVCRSFSLENVIQKLNVALISMSSGSKK